MGRRVETDMEYRQRVAGLVRASVEGDDAEMSRLFAEVCDNPAFDAVLAQATSEADTGEFDPVGFMYDLLSMASLASASYNSTAGRAQATIQLFFVPLTGPVRSIEGLSDSSDKLTDIGMSFIDTGLATRDSTLVVCGSLLDPLAAAAMTPGKLRLAMRLITPVLTGRMGQETLGEALSAVFGTDAPSRHSAGTFLANRLVPVARIITPPDGVIREDALTSYRIDDEPHGGLSARRWQRTMEDIMPPDVIAAAPCSLMRGRAIMATRMIEHVFTMDAVRFGLEDIPRLDRIEITMQEDVVHMRGAKGMDEYGPVNIPAALFFSDMAMLSEVIDGLADEVAWTDEPRPVSPAPRPH